MLNTPKAAENCLAKTCPAETPFPTAEKREKPHWPELRGKHLSPCSLWFELRASLACPIFKHRLSVHRLRALVHPSPGGDPLGSPGRSLLSLDASERFKTMTKKPNQNSQYIWPTMSSKLCRALKKPEGSSSHYKPRSPKPVPRGDGCTLRLEFFTGVKVTTLLSCSWLFGSPVIWLDLLLLFPLGNCSPLFCVSSSSCSGVASLTGWFDVLGLSGAGSSST